MPLNIIRAWKDRDYRNSLDEEQLAALPENPAGSIDLTDITDDELAYIQGGDGADPNATLGCTVVWTQCGGCDPPDDDQRNVMIGAEVVVTATLIATAIVAPPVTVPAVMVVTAPVGI